MPVGKTRMKQGEDDLLAWCAGRMERVRSPQAARELVDRWYRDWRGKEGKPSSCKTTTRKRPGGKLPQRTHHTDRVSKWLHRQVSSGRVVCVDNEGPNGAKRYRLVEGQRLTGPKRKPAVAASEKAPTLTKPKALKTNQ